MELGDEIYWWRRVSSSIDFPYRGRIVRVGQPLLCVCVKDVAAGDKEVIRHVKRTRVQLLGEYCTKIHGQGPSLLSPMKEWGRFTRYIEVDLDLRAKRHVDLFENSYMLRYDRTHWVDSYGMLGDARINRNQLAGPWGTPEEISAHEFQPVWTEAGNGDLWNEQLKTSRSTKLGEVPIWLARHGWQPPHLASTRK